MKDRKFELKVIECLYDDVGWAIHSVCFDGRKGEDFKPAMVDARAEFPKNRIRVRTYKPEK